MPKNRRTIGVPEFAHRARLRYQAALDVLLAGEVEGVRDGRRWMIYADAAEGWLTKREAPPHRTSTVSA